MDPRPYRIGDLVQRTGLSRTYLRQLEAERIIEPATRTRGRQRRYTEAEFQRATDAALAAQPPGGDLAGARR